MHASADARSKLLQFLKSLLTYQERQNTSVESAGKGTLNALPRIFTGNPQVDRAHMVLPTRARQFLDKCLDRPSYFFELDQLQRPLVENVNSLLQQMDLALEQHAQVTFKLRFAQLAWYRSYREFAMARGWTLCASFDRFGALLPQLVAVGFEEFVQRIKPDANQTTRDWMLRLTLAGFRYDYLTRDEQTNTCNYSDSNDGYLFILPLSIGHHL